MIFHALVVVAITLAKQKKHYMKGKLNIPGLTITVLFTNISMTSGCSTFVYIASLHPSLSTSSVPIQSNGKFDLKIASINLDQDNTEIIDGHKN